MVTRWLFDTNVLSELARPKPEPRVLAFIERTEAPWLSVASVHELHYGLTVAPPAQKRRLGPWIAEIEQNFAERIVPVSSSLARLSAELRGQEEKRGRVLHPLDALIAATALEMGASLATRNVSDFETLPLELFNPWA